MNFRKFLLFLTHPFYVLGREVAYHLAKCQADVVLACRDRLKAQKAVEFIENRLKTESSSPTSSSTEDKTSGFGKLHVMDLDLADLRSIDSFVDEFGRRFTSLHLLINNAGFMAAPYSTSRGGQIESHFAVNHLGHFYLTNLLLPILKRSAPSRVLIVTSGYYRKLAQSASSSSEPVTVASIFGGVDKGSDPDYDPLKAYARSKLANCLHGVELAKRLKDDNVQVFVIRPGFVRGTELGRHFSGFLTTLAKPFIWMFSQTAEQGAQTYLHCALAESDSELKSGGLYYNCSLQPYLDNLVNDKNAGEFWELSERLVKKEKEVLERS